MYPEVARYNVIVSMLENNLLNSSIFNTVLSVYNQNVYFFLLIEKYY